MRRRRDPFANLAGGIWVFVVEAAVVVAVIVAALGVAALVLWVS